MARLLTVHCMVRNEPFVYYAVRSVYDVADVILLYDTGSYDAHTLEDIRALLAEDKAGKIIFRQTRLETGTEEVNWSIKTFQAVRAKNKGKRCLGVVRREMIEATETPFFMILDGDEVHYRQGATGVRRIVEEWPPADRVLPRDPSLRKTIEEYHADYHRLFPGVWQESVARIPLRWYFDLENEFGTATTGRIFKTELTGIRTLSPGEMHIYKPTGEPAKGIMPCTFEVLSLPPFAHFERFLKPWRREVDRKLIKKCDAPLPEIMLENPQYLRRFLRKNEVRIERHG